MKPAIFLMCTVLLCNEIGFAFPLWWYFSCPELVKRSTWHARSPKETHLIISPLKFVIIHHTVTDTCDSKSSCSETVKNIQDYHMDRKDFNDIAYNFLVGGDGKIYEGAGWAKEGSHTAGYNAKSIGLAFIGNFEEQNPTRKQIQAAKSFLKCAVKQDELYDDYELYGARQVTSTLSPGKYLYEEIQNW